MKNTEFNQALLDFLSAAKTPFHAVKIMAKQLQNAGFEFLAENQSWQMQPQGRYFTLRNGSALVAWVMPKAGQEQQGLRMLGAHTDSPCLKVKPQPEINKQGYIQLGVEVYGGALLNPWFDRDLSLAGRVSYLTKDQQLSSALIDFKQPIAVIPSLAIHLDREANKNHSVNAQLHLPPVLGQAEKFSFRDLLKTQLQTEGVDNIEQVLDYDLNFYDTQLASLVGLSEEFIASARLDNLLSCFMGIQALVNSDNPSASLLVFNDHEEVGSMSAEGAQGPMLKQVIERILPDTELRNQSLANSILISADNAHAIHPNFMDKHDANHGPILNKGAVIKVNVNQRYATNAETSALYRHLAQQEGVPVQVFTVHSDMACGSTIGPIIAAELGVSTLDIGVPQLGMHSVRELVGSQDAYNFTKVMQRFFKR